jgi:hypothetical protein
MSIALKRKILEVQTELSALGKLIQQCKDENESLRLALETERSAANLYARQVAHWIGKHDALLEQQLEANK